MITVSQFSHHALGRIIACFFAWLVLFNSGYYIEKTLSGKFIDLPYTRIVTWASALIGQIIMPIPVTMQGDIILGSNSTAVVVRGGCNGLEAVFLMLAGILAYPSTWVSRLRACLIYLPVLFVLNVLRILLLLWIMTEYTSYIDFFHFQVGQAVLVIFVLAFWLHHIHKGDHAK